MIARIRRIALAGLVLTITVVLAPRAGAQHAPSTSGAAVEHRVTPAGPTIDRAAIGARPVAQQPARLDEAETAMQQRLGLGRARALMIVGFGAVVVGLLIGDDIGTLIAVAGAAVGLYGLYHYLK